jgi:hypothetical protein
VSYHCDHCGRVEQFCVLCPDCEELACTDCGRVLCCCYSPITITLTEDDLEMKTITLHSPELEGRHCKCGWPYPAGVELSMTFYTTVVIPSELIETVICPLCHTRAKQGRGHGHMTMTSDTCDDTIEPAPAPDAKPLTIKLTDGSLVTLSRNVWPVVSSASKWDADATRELTVRRNSDGQAVVYGMFHSHRQHEDGKLAGELAHSPVDHDYLVAVIRRVAADCACEELADHCIARLANVIL